jgi:hypothetical protein
VERKIKETTKPTLMLLLLFLLREANSVSSHDQAPNEKVQYQSTTQQASMRSTTRERSTVVLLHFVGALETSHLLSLRMDTIVLSLTTEV